MLEKGKNDFVRWMKDHHFSAEEQQQLTEILEQQLQKWNSAGSQIEKVFPPAPPAIFLSGPTQTPKLDSPDSEPQLHLLLEGEMEKAKGKEKERNEEENGMQDSHIILAAIYDEATKKEDEKEQERILASLKKMAAAANTEEGASVVRGKIEELLNLNKQIKVPPPPPPQQYHTQQVYINKPTLYHPISKVFHAYSSRRKRSGARKLKMNYWPSSSWWHRRMLKSAAS